jgi:hypothetical protein
LLKASRAAFHLPVRVVPGEPLYLGVPDRTMVTLCVSLPLEGIILGTVVGCWKQELEWYLSTMSTTLSLGGVVQRGLGDVKGICPRGNNKVVIILFHVHNRCLFLVLELY